MMKPSFEKLLVLLVEAAVDFGVVGGGGKRDECRLVPLFHPRLDRCKEHFRLDAARISPLSESFVTTFFGRMFSAADTIFTADMLRPELQSLVTSDWYQARLDTKAGVDQALWKRHVAYLESFLTKPNYQSELKRLRIQERITEAKTTLAHVSSPAYRASLRHVGAVHGLTPYNRENSLCVACLETYPITPVSTSAAPPLKRFWSITSPSRWDR